MDLAKAVSHCFCVFLVQALKLDEQLRSREKKRLFPVRSGSGETDDGPEADTELLTVFSPHTTPDTVTSPEPTHGTDDTGVPRKHESLQSIKDICHSLRMHATLHLHKLSLLA